jgi:hypothetical protein
VLRFTPTFVVEFRYFRAQPLPAPAEALEVAAACADVTRSGRGWLE